jgi:MFS family permease
MTAENKSGVDRPALSSRHIAAATIGNALEFYDFLTYAFFSIQIGHAFFPAQSAYGSLMLSLATFGAGFVTRPIGALVIGAYSDRAGRKPAMMLCFILIGCSILGMALIPTYAAIGIAAPILAVLARMLQGSSLGGEIGSNTAFLYLLLIYPMFTWVVATREPLALILGMTILSVAFNFIIGSFSAGLAESLPKMIRGSGFSTVYSISIATFGGTTQLVVTWLIHVTGSPMAPAWYAIGAAAVGQIALMLMPESAPVRWKAMPAVVAIAATPA